MSSIKKVLIVGSGLGGMSLGIALRQIGIEVEIAEINKEFNVYGVGILQQPNHLRALDTLGLADACMERGSLYGLIKMCTDSGQEFGKSGVPPVGRFDKNNGISRKVYHEILYEKAVSIGVTFRMGLTVSELKNEEESVNVKFTDGSEGDYQLVVGADGVRSKVRSLVFGNLKPEYIGMSVWRYAFKRSPDLDTGYIFYGKKTKAGIVAMNADMMYIFVVAAEGNDNPHIPDHELVPRLKAHLSEYPAKMVADLVEQVTDPEKVVYRPLESLLLPDPWYKNRVVLIGDAAHATIPQLGSGAALAVEDAVVLAEELAKEQSIETALETYMKRRFERCKMTCDASLTLAAWEKMEWENLPLPEGANIGMLYGKALGALTSPI
ncbi:MAG: FAD-dependent monooxygenase [Arcicella sp.]|nr:FAD-dependent monooxygenase [Arcicella sp.]